MRLKLPGIGTPLTSFEYSIGESFDQSNNLTNHVILTILYDNKGQDEAAVFVLYVDTRHKTTTDIINAVKEEFSGDGLIKISGYFERDYLDINDSRFTCLEWYRGKRQ
jgi:hypothetical protein